jgi:hypothetical protein
MTSKNKGRPLDRYIFARTVEGVRLRSLTALGLLSQGITTEYTEETIDRTPVLVLTVTGKRPGEGRIAADMKARK